MSNNKLLDQFRSFYFRNYPGDMEQLIEHFAVFGGLGWQLEISASLIELVRDVILENFDTLNHKINELVLHDKSYKRLLHALARGDRRMFSAFNKAGLNNQNGGVALNYLQEKGLIQIEYSREDPPKPAKPNEKLKREDARRRISHKVLFTKPFLRFWFYFIYPHAKEIKNKKFEKVLKSFKEKRNSYTSLIFEELSEILLNYYIRDSQIVSSGSYWDAKVEIDIFTITEKGKIYVGECKWTNHIINKKELHKLVEKCELINIKPDQITFFSKRGFSKELEQNQSKELALYSCEDFAVLLKNISREQLIEELI